MATSEQAINCLGEIENQIGFSQIVKVGDTYHVSGIVAATEELTIACPGDMEGQVKHIYGLMQHFLAAQGLSLKNVIKEVVYVTDFEAMKGAMPTRNAAYETAGAAFPACTMVGIKDLFMPEAMIEIEVIAVR